MIFQPVQRTLRERVSAALSLVTAAALVLGAFLIVLPTAEAESVDEKYTRIWDATVNGMAWSTPTPGLLVWNGDNFGSNDEIDEPFCNVIPTQTTLNEVYRLRELRASNHTQYQTDAPRYENDTITTPGYNTNKTGTFGGGATITWNTLTQDVGKRVGDRIEPAAPRVWASTDAADASDVSGSVAWYTPANGTPPTNTKEMNLYCYTPEQFRWAMKEMERRIYQTSTASFGDVNTNETTSPIVAELGDVAAPGLDTRVNIFLMADFDMGGAGDAPNAWAPLNQPMTTLNVFSLNDDMVYNPTAKSFTINGQTWQAAPDGDRLLANTVAGGLPDAVEPHTLYNLNIVDPAEFQTVATLNGDSVHSTGLIRTTPVRTGKGATIQSVGLAFCNVAFDGLRIDASGATRGGGTGLVGEIRGSCYGGVHMNNVRVDNALVIANKSGGVSAASGVLCGRGDFGDPATTPKSFRLCSLSNVRVLGNMHNATLSGVIDTATFENCYAVDGLVLSNNQNGHSGGLVSCANSAMHFKECFVSAEVYGRQASGGFIGYCGGSSRFEHCYSAGFVEGTPDMGGFIGEARTATYAGNASSDTGPIEFIDCYSTAMVGMEQEAKNVGGFVGVVRPANVADRKITFKSCYAAGEVGTLTNSYSVLNTDGQNTTAGGFAGRLVGVQPVGGIMNAEFNRCVYDMQTTAMYNRPIGYLEGCTIPKYAGGVLDGDMTNNDLLPRINTVLPELGGAVDDTYFEITGHMDGSVDNPASPTPYSSPVHIHGVTTTALTFGGLASEEQMDHYAGTVYQAYPLEEKSGSGDTAHGTTNTWAPGTPYDLPLNHLWDFDKYDATGGIPLRVPPYTTDGSGNITGPNPDYAGSTYANAKRHWAYTDQNKGLYPQLLNFYEASGFLRRDAALVKAWSAAGVTTVFVNDWTQRAPTVYGQESFGSVQSIVSTPAFSSRLVAGTADQQFRNTNMGSYAAVTNPSYEIEWEIDPVHQQRAGLLEQSPVFGNPADPTVNAPDILTLVPASTSPAAGSEITPIAPNTSSASVVIRLRDAENKAVPGVTYTLYDATGFRVSGVTSDRNGRIVFNGLQNLESSQFTEQFYTIQESTPPPSLYMEKAREWRVETSSGATSGDAIVVALKERDPAAANTAANLAPGTGSEENPLVVNYLPKTAYEADEFYPGVRWVKANVTYDGETEGAVTATRYLRLSFTSYFDVGENVLITMDQGGNTVSGRVGDQDMSADDAIQSILNKVSFGFGTQQGLKYVNEHPESALDFQANLEDDATFLTGSERGPLTYNEYNVAAPAANKYNPNPYYLNEGGAASSRLGVYTTKFGPNSLTGLPDMFQGKISHTPTGGTAETVPWNTMEVNFQRMTKDPTDGTIHYVDMWDTLDPTWGEAEKLAYCRTGRDMLLGNTSLTLDLIGNYRILFRWTLFDGRIVEKSKLVTVTSAVDVTLQKVDENGDPLVGAVFQVYDPVTVGEITSVYDDLDHEDLLTFKGLTKGIYYVTEVVAPVGCEGMQGKTWVLFITEGTDGKMKVQCLTPDGTEAPKNTIIGSHAEGLYQIVNHPIKVDFAFLKTRADTGGPLGGLPDTQPHRVRFELQNPISGTTYRESGLVGSDGAVWFTNVTVGTYTLVETKAQLGFITTSASWTVNVVDAKPGSIEPGKDKVAVTFTGAGFPAGGVKLPELTAAGAAAVRITNEPLRLDLSFYKTGGKDKWPLPGAEFGLYTADGTTQLATAVSDARGMVTFPKRTVGRYLLRELQAPQGFVFYKSKSTWPVEITADVANNTLEAKISGVDPSRFYVNNPEMVHPTDYTELVIWKTDEQGQKLPGAVFGLFDGEKEIYRAVSDEKGRAELRVNLPYYSETAWYTLRELQAPEGYIATKETWQVRVPRPYEVEVRDRNGNAPALSAAGWMTVVNQSDPVKQPSVSPHTSDPGAGKIAGGLLLLLGGMLLLAQSLLCRRKRAARRRR